MARGFLAKALMTKQESSGFQILLNEQSPVCSRNALSGLSFILSGFFFFMSHLIPTYVFPLTSKQLNCSFIMLQLESLFYWFGPPSCCWQSTKTNRRALLSWVNLHARLVCLTNPLLLSTCLFHLFLFFLTYSDCTLPSLPSSISLCKPFNHRCGKQGAAFYSSRLAC